MSKAVQVATSLFDRKGYKGGRDSVWSLALGVAIWFGSNIQRDSADTKAAVSEVRASLAEIKKSQDAFDKRITALERCEERFNEIDKRVRRIEARSGNGSIQPLYPD